MARPKVSLADDLLAHLEAETANPTPTFAEFLKSDDYEQRQEDRGMPPAS